MAGSDNKEIGLSFHDGGDVFGDDLGDVDPFGDEDEFGGDNDINDDDDVDSREKRRSSRKLRSTRKSKDGEKSSSRDSVTSSDRRSRSSGRSNDKSSRSRSKSRSRKSQTRSKKSSLDGSQHSRRRSSARVRSDGSPTKSSKSRSKSSKQKEGLDPFDPRNADAFSDDHEDPFGVGTPTTVASTVASDDGFGHFPDFSSVTSGPTNSGEVDFANFGGTPDQPENDGFDDFARMRTGGKPSRHRSSAAAIGKTINFEEFTHGHTPQRRRNSLDGSTHTAHSTSSAPSTRFRLKSKASGGMRMLRPAEQQAMVRESSERRNAIKDSLFGALGDDDDDMAPGLSNFLNQNNRRSSSSSSRRSSSGDNFSVHSAPAPTRPQGLPRGPRRSSTTSRNGDLDCSTHSNMTMKSRRYQRKMSGGAPPLLPKGARDTPTRAKEPMKLDVAALAEQGYLEVQDGKMRLVIDIETETR